MDKMSFIFVATIFLAVGGGIGFILGVVCELKESDRHFNNMKNFYELLLNAVVGSRKCDKCKKGEEIQT